MAEERNQQAPWDVDDWVAPGPGWLVTKDFSPTFKKLPPPLGTLRTYKA